MADRPVIDGTRFAHYEISTHADGSAIELGRGAMGVTYRAIDTTLRCAVALKVVAPEIVGNDRARARFLREAQAAASLRHPHVASVFFCGERTADRQPFYAMELIEGETLQARVRRAGGLPVDDVLAIGAQVAAALAAAEARGLAHRDLKPANLMLVAGERVNVKVIDFGLAKAAADEADEANGLTSFEAFVGTPAFASPEHFNAWQEVDARSDFYALGATLWYALTGHAPFAGRTPAEVQDRQRADALSFAQLRAARVPCPVVELLRALLLRDPAGRPQTARALIDALERCRAQVSGTPTTGRRRRLALAAAAAVLLPAAILASVLIGRHARRIAPPVSDKSIAVLPFDNLSTDKNDAFFANGVQDEILTDLARVADLKVISRSSVLGYADPARRPPAHEIGRALGVSYLLEGGVRRAGNRVRLTARLIDTAHDREVWADSFDRELSDVFAIQSEVANTITGKLQVRLSGEDKAALNAPPTRDFAAYELFLHAKEIRYNFYINASNLQPLFEEVRLLDEATARDPNFYEAFDLLAIAHINLCLFKADPTPTERRALIEETLGKLRRLRPDAGETHLDAAAYYYKISHDTARGRQEMVRARQKLTNNWRVLYLTGIADYVDGRWAEATEVIQEQLPLNPRNPSAVTQLVNLYDDLRLWDEARRVEENAMAAGTNPDYYAMRHAMTVLDQTGDTSEAHAYLRQVSGQPDPKGNIFDLQMIVAAYEHDQEAGTRAVAARYSQQSAGSDLIPPAYYTGYLALWRGDLIAARKDYALARPYFEAAVNHRPDSGLAWADLSLLDARSGRKEDALREGLEAVRLTPIARDGAEGPGVLQSLVLVYAQIGDKDRALNLLESMENVPHLFGYGYLARDPGFDSLRGDFRFEAIVEAFRKPVDLSKFNPADFPAPTGTVAP